MALKNGDMEEKMEEEGVFVQLGRLRLSDAAGWQAHMSVLLPQAQL